MGNEILFAVFMCVIAYLGLLLYQHRELKKLNIKIDALTLLLKETDHQGETMKRELQELRSGTIGIGRRMQELEKKAAQQDARLDETNQQDPQAKLYTRAMKMVDLGAGVEELIHECEIPKAEAELLIRLHCKS
ncbi:DUF2802 domain-containing protein [Shewanella sp. VB17]|uniref:DUF2802 domain-containing protein n=1 Tax=Shewanella sp. VB17 TaxID=2739432 RepID=UPI0035C90704